MKKRKYNRFGSSLFELLLAIGLFSVGSLFIISIYSDMLHQIALSKQYRQATVLAENQMELLRTVDLSDRIAEQPQPFDPRLGSPEDLLPAGEAAYTVEEATAGYHVSATVTWMVNNQQRKYELHTLVSNRIRR